MVAWAIWPIEPFLNHQGGCGCDIALLRRDHMRGIENAGIVDIRFARILVDTLFDLVTEMRDQALDRPCRGISKRADGVTLDLFRHFQQHVDLALVAAPLPHPRRHPPPPPPPPAPRPP